MQWRDDLLKTACCACLLLLPCFCHCTFQKHGNRGCTSDEVCTLPKKGREMGNERLSQLYRRIRVGNGFLWLLEESQENISLPGVTEPGITVSAQVWEGGELKRFFPLYINCIVPDCRTFKWANSFSTNIMLLFCFEVLT